ncbi:hypothetical protein BDV09DRAFT_180952 [Aspergillus tetrazonus]
MHCLRSIHAVAGICLAAACVNAKPAVVASKTIELFSEATLEERAPTITSRPDPPVVDFGDAETYRPRIGVDTNYLTWEESSTKWIGVWTEYLTQGPSTTEYIKMHTATATEDGQRPGDVAILVPPVVATALANTVTKSMEACKLPIVKRRVRTGELVCLLEEGFGHVEKGALEVIPDSAWALPEIPINDILPLDTYGQETLSLMLQVLKTQARRNMLKMLYVSSIISLSVSGVEAIKHEWFHRFNIPANGIPKPKEEENGLTCDKNAPRDEFSLTCTDPNCNGPNECSDPIACDSSNDRCTTGHDKGCLCLHESFDIIAEYIPLEFFEVQDEIIEGLLNSSAGVPSKPFPTLRLLPLGDSITKGSGSSDDNGYRRRLHDLLLNDADTGGDNDDDRASKVDFIGTFRNGNFEDRDHQGLSGKRISDIAAASDRVVKARPNVILVHVGTNDLDKPVDPVETAPDRLRALLDGLREACPDAAILVSEVMLNTHTDVQAKINVFNQALNGIVTEKQNAGEHIAVVPMGNLLTSEDLAANDYKHPGNQGYKKMADAWFNAIDEANSRGWIKNPVEPEVTSGVGLGGTGSSRNICDGNNWERVGTVTPPLLKIWNEQGIFAYDGRLPTAKWVQWADINGDGRDDYLAIQKDGAVHAALFDENGQLARVVRNFAAGVNGFSGDKVHFADIDGDGYADYVLQAINGSATVSINTHNVGSKSGERNFEPPRLIAGGVDDVPGSKIRYADLNGDGRADYLILYDGGAVTAYINNGDYRFDEYGTVATGVSGAPGSRVVLTDVDGDGYADYVILAVERELPSTGCMVDSDCTGECDSEEDYFCQNDGKCKCEKKPEKECSKSADCLGKCSNDDNGFVCQNGACQCFFPEADVALGHTTCNEDKQCSSECRENMGFYCKKDFEECHCLVAYVDGRATEYECDPKDDWEVCDSHCPGAIGFCMFSQREDLTHRVCHCLDNVESLKRRDFSGLSANITMDRSAPSGQMQKQKRADGAESANPITFMRNTHKLATDGSGGNWAERTLLSTGVQYPEGSVHFVKFIHDKIPDYVVVANPDTDPAFGVWSGTGMYDKAGAIRFADLDGDGRDDYIRVSINGAVDAWLNKGANSLVRLPGLAPGLKGVTPEKVQFADVNGDGKADYLVVWEGGAVEAYLNTGQLAPSGKGDGRNWREKMVIAPGINGVPGDKIRFADIDGDGRADLLVLYDSGAIDGYLNTGVLNQDSSKRSWQKLSGPFAAGVNGVTGSKVRLADIDGDGLADYLVLYDGGAVHAYRNTGNVADDPNSRNFDDWGVIAEGVSGISGRNVYFADLSGDGKADYVAINEDGSIELLANKCGA